MAHVEPRRDAVREVRRSMERNDGHVVIEIAPGDDPTLHIAIGFIPTDHVSSTYRKDGGTPADAKAIAEELKFRVLHQGQKLAQDILVLEQLVGDGLFQARVFFRSHIVSTPFRDIVSASGGEVAV